MSKIYNWIELILYFQHSTRDEHTGQTDRLMVVTDVNLTTSDADTVVVVLETETIMLFIVEMIETCNQNWILIYKIISQNHRISQKDN